MLVVVAHGERPERLLAAVAGSLPAGARALARSAPWGSFLVADTAHAVRGKWLVAGRPQRDPWGLPHEDLPLDEAAGEFERYGERALLLGSGPFVAADLERGVLLRAPNGIVPVFEGASARGPVLATAACPVRSLVAGTRTIAPGCGAGPGAERTSLPTDPGEQLPGFRWDWLDEELSARIEGLGELSTARFPELPAGLERAARRSFRTARGDLVFVPRLRLPAERATAFDVGAVSALFGRARAGRRWLFAPGLERPMRDVVALAAGGVSVS